MSKVVCAVVDCVHNGDDYVCNLKAIHLSDNYIMTKWNGREHYQKCREYKRIHDELTDAIEQFIEVNMIRKDGEQDD